MGKKNKYKPQEAAPPPQQQEQQQQPQAVTASVSSSGQAQHSASQQSTGGWQTSGQQQRGQGGSQSWRGSAGPSRQQQQQQRGPPPGQYGGHPQQGQPGGQQRGPPPGQYGGHPQQGPPGGQQRGPPPGQYGGHPQQGPPGGRQRGPPSGQYGGHPQQGPPGGQQRGPPSGQQRGPPPGQQRGPPPGQHGGYQQQRGSSGPPITQVGNIKRGTVGRPGTCDVNYLNVDMSKMPEIAYHYDVGIVPERPKKFFRDAFNAFKVQYLNNEIAAYDGRKSCYSVVKLPNVTGEVKVVDQHGRTLNYKITVKETEQSVIELKSLHNYVNDKIYDKPMRAMQCLEVVLAEPCHQRAIRAGRSFFKTSEGGDRRDLGDGYEALVGLYQTFVLGDRPFVNVDVSHKSFPIAMTMIEYIEHYGLRMRVTQDTTITNSRFIIPFIKGINVIYEPPKSFGTAPRVYKVNGLSDYPASEHKFQSDKGTVTILEYFKSRNYKLKYPKLPCLSVGPVAKNIFLPLELCRIEEGQALNRKDGVNQVSEMIKFAATPTNVRKNKILDLLRYFNHNIDPTISRFGIHIAGDFITVNTRLLPAPQLEYRNSRYLSPMNGSWRSDRCQFLITRQKAHKWAILVDSRTPYNKAADFEDMVLRQSRNVNVVLEPKADIRQFKDERNLDEHFKDLKSKQFDLVFVVIPSRGATYDFIKQKAELTYGILTQCIKQNNFERRLNPQLVDNVLLKVNSKLNGINHKLKEDVRTQLANVMFVGADVTHPSPDQREIPSVVGVAASHDTFGANYNMQYRLQVGGGGGAREEIEDMESIVMEHLRVYHQFQKRYPDHIIYYRDGVSDGQFLKIKNLELKGIKAACAKTNINPKLCCVIVVKRHHTRFFPKGEGHPKFNKFNNVDPGTVVDRTIVHPNEMQFFMVSHQSIQGTAKPTRYNVIENTGDLDIDLLQQLTYNLCHMFPRCNRSVSYPAPAYLAHLAAARGRVYITGSRLSRSPKEEYEKRLVVQEFLKTNPMYFV